MLSFVSLVIDREYASSLLSNARSQDVGGDGSQLVLQSCCKSCRLIVERVDPIMSFNQIAGHVHTVNGGSNFSPTASHADLLNSQCSSCSVKEDMSAYWTPSLYFWRNDGSFQSVPQSGGSLIYYLFRFNVLDKNPVVQAFPPGLKMVSAFSYLTTYCYQTLQSFTVCFGLILPIWFFKFRTFAT